MAVEHSRTGPTSPIYTKGMSYAVHAAGWVALWAMLAGAPASAQAISRAAANPGLTLSTDSVGPARFVAVHGRRSAIFGYSENGLEIWSWPFQILSGYRISIRPQGAATEIDGDRLLRRIDYAPEAVTRTYIGADFVVREKLFVPLDRAAATITYTVEGRRHIDITVHFKPVLNLMWPASIGGQSVAWKQAISGYVISDGTNNHTATIRSDEIISHDETENSAVHNDTVAFAIRPDHSAHVVVVLNPTDNPAGSVTQLAADTIAQEEEATAHYARLMDDTLQVVTPNEEINRALAWSEIALDQAWVCNPDLGCGIVAGYGPSRNARRPQYAWFFAGDGLVATDALMAAGEYDRARAELEFILKYQDRKTGMIWHELSQSAGYLDWAGKYPYMFVHVDITFQFLDSLARYVQASGDMDFAREHWPAIASAYLYCQSVIDPATSLPRIPSDKEGSNEQDRESDELSLSAAWVDAASGFAKLARWTSHAKDETQAAGALEAARRSIAARYWDGRRQFWISGHTIGGREIFDERSQPSGLLSQGIFSTEQNEILLDKIASSKFQTDWGSRGLSSDSAAFDPDSYAKGSVFALNTTAIAETFWNEHRPAAAFAIWSTLVPWTRLDSLGHIHEVLAGNVYHQQTESVPEQTWSSAGFISAAVRGLLGLHIDSVANQISFSPHLPPEWHEVTVRNIHTQHAVLDLQLTRSGGEMDLTVTNHGQPVSFIFDPQIPLGAQLLGAQCGSRRITPAIERNAHDEHARLTSTAPGGTMHCEIHFRGGVELIPPHVVPLLGNPSSGIKITGVDLRDKAFIVEADASQQGPASFEIQTPWRPGSVENCTIHPIGGNLYQVDLDRVGATFDAFGYTHRRAVIHFQ